MDRMVSVLKAAGIVLAFVSVSAWRPAVTLAEETYDYTVVDADGVYLGQGKHPRQPAQISADQVWAEIPEYKQILDEKLTDDDPKYHLLLRKATARFERALKKASERDGYDMIAEVGAIDRTSDDAAEIPDITSDLIDFVSR